MSDDARQWSAIKESLSQGRDPGISSSRLIWLDTIDSIELPEADAIGLAICYTANGKEQRRSTEFRSRVARKVFLNALEEYNGVYFLSERHEVGLVRATAGPWIVVSIVLLLVTSAAWASAYWTAHPPPPPIGKTEQDWLVRQLVWLGPFKLFMIGAVPFLLSFVWLLKRTLFPPHVHVLTKGSERISGWTIAAQVDSALGESADSAQSSIAFRDATPMAPSGNSYGWKLSALSPLVLMLCGALVPLGEYVDRVRKQAREEQVKREKLQNDLDEQIKSVREGKVKAGEAFRRLFQIDDPTEKRAK
ncbi:MAG TPA: hypothetical protein VGY55_23665 [Pirellulales bacterium]|nr:hypothetical protein [Pirellulales bacterium]